MGQRTGRRAERTDPRCSFCKKTSDDVGKLIAGPDVYICDRCVTLCNEILVAAGRGGAASEESEETAGRERVLSGDVDGAPLTVGRCFDCGRTADAGELRTLSIRLCGRCYGKLLDDGETSGGEVS